MNRSEIIQQIINKIKAKSYLEIGVEYGTIFMPLKVAYKIAVDPHFKISLRKKLLYPSNYFKSKYFEMTSNDFFKNHSDILFKNKIDVAFIDGLHNYKQSLIDFNNCYKYLNKNGVIIMHDCNPLSKAAATSPMEEAIKISDWSGSWCGNVWKTIVNLRSLRDDLCVFVIEDDYGVAIITRGNTENRLSYSADEIQNLTYEELSKDRIGLLNLKPTNYLQTFLNLLK